MDSWGTAMFADPIPTYSLPPLVGLIANATLLAIGLGALILRRSYPALAQSLLFYLALVVFFLGYTLYGLQESPASIRLWYRVMLAGLATMPVGQTWFARRLLPGLPRALAWAVTGISLFLACLALLGQGPWLVDLRLEPHGGYQGILRPASLALRPLIYAYTLCYCLLLLGAVGRVIGRAPAG
jgi:hypothetical protein